MVNILAGGFFVQTTVPVMAVLTTRNLPRRHLARVRRPLAQRRRQMPQSIACQPGQLASPFLKFGFPSLLVH